MKLLRSRSLFLLIALSLASCNKFPKRGQSLNKGSIISSYDIKDDSSIRFREGISNWVITSKTQFDELFVTPFGKDSLPPIDFNQHTLIGCYITGSCQLRIIREVSIDASQKKYNYSILYKDNGACFAKAIDYNFVLVPKLPADYTVTFKAKEKGL